jgi:hypothetical protein
VLGFEAPLTIETDVALIPALAAGEELDIEELELDIAGFWPKCNVSVVTIAGTILIRRCALLAPKEAVNCS